MGVGRSPPRHRGDGRQLRRGAAEPPEEPGQGPRPPAAPRAPDGAGGAGPRTLQLGTLVGVERDGGEAAGRSPTPTWMGTSPTWSLLASPVLRARQGLAPQLDRKGHGPEGAPAALGQGTRCRGSVVGGNSAGSAGPGDIRQVVLGGRSRGRGAVSLSQRPDRTGTRGCAAPLAAPHLALQFVGSPVKARKGLKGGTCPTPGRGPAPLSPSHPPADPRCRGAAPDGRCPPAPLGLRSSRCHPGRGQPRGTVPTPRRDGPGRERRFPASAPGRPARPPSLPL